MTRIDTNAVVGTNSSLSDSEARFGKNESVLEGKRLEEVVIEREEGR